jgi:methionyl-tRNA synthetase
VLFTLAAGLKSVIVLLWPIIPGSAERALASLGQDPAVVALADAAFGAGVAGARVTAIPPLFPRVEGRPE